MALFLAGGLAYAEEPDLDWIRYGPPIIIPQAAPKEKRPKTDLDREIDAFLAPHQARGCRLINNTLGRALNDDGRLIGAEPMGRAVNPTEVIIIAPTMVAQPIVELYTSIKKLPEHSESVCIWYTESLDRSESSLLGYTTENPRGVYTKLVKYGGKTPWLQWITDSFKKDDGEQGGVDQPATVPKSKPEGNQKTKSESEARPQ